MMTKEEHKEPVMTKEEHREPMMTKEEHQRACRCFTSDGSTLALGKGC